MLRPALFFKLVCDSVIFLYSALILTKKWFGSNSASEVYRTVVPELYGIQTAYFQTEVYLSVQTRIDFKLKWREGINF